MGATLMHDEIAGPSLIEPYGHAVIVTINRPVEVDLVDRIEAAVRALSSRKGSKVGLVVHIAKMFPPPGDDVRDRISLGMRQFERSVCGLAVLIPQSGLGGVAWRTMHSTFFLITRTKYDKKVFSDAGDASRWLALRVPGLNASALAPQIIQRAKAG